MPLRHKKHFIFDMDGTLTLAVHDFDAMRRRLGLPPNQPILESIGNRSAKEQAQLHERLNRLETGYAENAEQQPFADALLSYLAACGASLGILTRNSVPLAKITLASCGLLKYFKPENIIGRENIEPKPNPAGIAYLLQAWNAEKQDCVIIGDFMFDLKAGRAAGITTVHLATDGDFAWPELTDIAVTGLDEILLAAGGLIHTQVP